MNIGTKSRYVNPQKSGSVEIMPDSPKDDPQDPARQSLADILTNLPAVRAAKKVNTMSRVHRRLIEPLDDSEQGRDLAFQHTIFCQTGLPYRNPGDDRREWQREQGAASLLGPVPTKLCKMAMAFAEDAFHQ